MSKSPDLVAYNVRNVEGREAGIWTRCGAAWKHPNGEGFNVQLDTFPLDGRLVLIKPKSKDDAEG